jgi:hypothetical protein
MVLNIILILIGIAIGAAIQYNVDRCRHTWKIIKTVEWSNDFGAKWSAYHMLCEKCGTVKIKHMK